MSSRKFVLLECLNLRHEQRKLIKDIENLSLSSLK